jgi:hypothetical protein
MTLHYINITYFHPNRHAGKSCALIVRCAFDLTPNPSPKANLYTHLSFHKQVQKLQIEY